MKSTRRLFLFGAGLITLFLAIGAVAYGITSADAGLQQRQAGVNWHAQSGSGPVDGGWATLQITEQGAAYAFNTSQLIPGHAYTLWVVMINNPAACAASPCAPTDIFNPVTQSQVTYGTGHVVGESGNGAFSGYQAAGDVPGGWLEGVGFTNPLGAEIHLVLNDHGPKLQGYMPEMIRTYRAGCTDASLPAIFPPSAFADGTPGPNTCRLYQTAVFQAPN